MLERLDRGDRGGGNSAHASHSFLAALYLSVMAGRLPATELAGDDARQDELSGVGNLLTPRVTTRNIGVVVDDRLAGLGDVEKSRYRCRTCGLVIKALDTPECPDHGATMERE
ncbi:MAG: hypothetical protein HHJ14_08930 [Cellulomonas sp.]|nr:hypothetical protein [Cellulomonas sp.]